ncbi:MAG: mycofactocin biosynthesis peptidyl-dipeptidase MftE [Mycobacterium sp.]
MHPRTRRARNYHRVVTVRRELGECTSGQLSGAAPTVVVPLGSTEQHGPHLPLDTDTRIAVAVAGRVAADLGYLRAPAIAYGASGEHQGFPGTVSIGSAALTAVLLEYGRSACEWARRLVFVNGHGGNVEALRRAVTLLREEGRDVAWISCTAEGGDAHAGYTETSLLLHLSADAVRTEHMAPGNTEALADLMPRMRRDGVAAVSASGVLGDPTGASATAGEAILAGMVDDFSRRVRSWAPDGNGMLT